MGSGNQEPQELVQECRIGKPSLDEYGYQVEKPDKEMPFIVKDQGESAGTNECGGVYDKIMVALGKPIPVSNSRLHWKILNYKDNDFTILEAAENYKSLVKAKDLLQHCFGSMDEFIHELVMNWESASADTDYRRCYTVIVQEDSKVLSAALMKLSEQVAELPLVGTHMHYRNRGFCNILLEFLEDLLLSLGIKRLVLPSMSARVGFWRKRGFSELLDDNSSAFMTFEGCTLMEKHLEASEKPYTSDTGLRNLVGIPFALKHSRFAFKLLKYRDSGLNVLGMAQNIEIFAEAKQLLEDWYGPVIFPITGRELIGDVVFNRDNYTDFYIVALVEEKAEEGKAKSPVLAAGVLHILSESEDQLVELSLIGARKQYLH